MYDDDTIKETKGNGTTEVKKYVLSSLAYRQWLQI
jgi:hypothetical protein